MHDEKIRQCVKGMGSKIVEFHAIMHLSNDTLIFGVPMETDTGSDEPGHKQEKTAAKLTQKKKEAFDQQQPCDLKKFIFWICLITKFMAIHCGITVKREKKNHQKFQKKTKKMCVVQNVVLNLMRNRTGMLVC